ncbi:MAG: RagB/SusD family nutrient uptake outer membrane protein [Prevotella sp.]|nr:RagB/SusD family nutrient uptake outer membrane protein [Prevotella sp.]
MNNIYKYGKLALASAILIGVTTACSDDFLTKKKNYGSFDSSNTYGSYSGANERVANLYFQLLPIAIAHDGNGVGNVNNFTSIGWADKYAKSTEEFGGFSIYTNPEEELIYSSENLYDLFYVANDVYSPWGHVRGCNDVIEGVSGSDGLTEDEKNKLLGQAYFFRAYMYYQMVKIYGGVPIIDYVQDPILGNGGGDLIKPRATTKQCIDFICEDLDKASSMLPARWENDANDFGRITSGLAEALKGNLLLLYASPLFNRGDETSRWEAAYEANKAALAKLDLGRFGLVYANNGGEQNAANWARLWMDYTGSEGNISEAVFVTLCNLRDNVSGQPNYGKYNYTEHYLRPKNSNGGGSLTPTAEMIDLFPMADGKKPSESSIQYDKNKFWLNRDPRFYRTFAFPGVEWQFDEGTVRLSDEALKTVIPSYYPTGRDYSLWSYTWYDKAEDQTSLSASGYSPDLLETTNHAIYLRKRSDDYHLHPTAFYEFLESASTPKGFQKCGAPLITMRYAEVLLNFAEAAAGAGHYDEAVQALQKIRARVGYTASNNYGLDASISGDRAKLLSAILYERQIELAYEGKRFDDMRRWMLFDGGADQASIKASWALTGFGGNTCTYLGVKPLNGTKRHQIIMYSTVVAEKETSKDPLFDLRPKALSLDEDMSYDASTGYANDAVKALAEFYDNNLVRKDANLDGNDDALTIKFLPKYYFIGLRYNAMQTNVTLHQTVGWHDLNRNAEGLFDPLADTAPAE